MKSISKQDNIKINNKKNLKSAAKKRNNSSKDFDFAIEESNILELIGKNAVDKEFPDKKLGFEELFTDFESNISLKTN
jgi:hypothetical protein